MRSVVAGCSIHAAHSGLCHNLGLIHRHEDRTAMTGSRCLRACGAGYSLFPRGFTLLELLVVMVIIGLLAGYVGPRFFSQIGKSEVKTAQAQIDAFGKALDQYRLDVGRYPSTEQGLQALNAAPAGEGRWAGPYLQKAVPADPWGQPYQYRQPGEHGEYDLLSWGADGKPGGEGTAADIGSW
jgi:general secretion pathway protein G